LGGGITIDKNIKLKQGQKIAVAIIEQSNASRGMDMTMDNIGEWCLDCEVINGYPRFIVYDTLADCSINRVLLLIQPFQLEKTICRQYRTIIASLQKTNLMVTDLYDTHE
jgi:hypothetical protein